MINGKKVVVAGHICVDITPIFGDGVMDPEKLFAPGKMLFMDGASVNAGGAVANTGLAMSILGADVSLIGKVGNDEFGRLLFECLEKYHIDAERDMIVSPNVSTSYSVVIAAPDHDRMFLHCAGANDTFCTNDIDYSRIRDASLFHFGYPPLMKHMYQNDGDELIRLFQDIKALGIATSLDMSGIDPHSELGEVDWERILRGVLPYVDFFMPSAEELCIMTDPERFSEWEERAKGDDVMKYVDVRTDIKPLADKIIDNYHGKVVVVKCGCQGIYYKTAGYNMISEIGANVITNVPGWSEKEAWIKAYRPSVIRSATGVGDTSIAAFLTSALEGMNIQDCARFAAAEGACCLEGYDALSTLRTIPELQKMFLMGL